MPAKRQFRFKSLLIACVTAASIIGCTSSDEPGTTEPVAPEMEANTGYPEDPDLGAPSGEEQTAVTEPANPEDDTPGELTEDPYGGTPPQENTDTPPDIMEQPSTAESEEAPGEDFSGAFEDPLPEYEPTPGGDDDTSGLPEVAGSQGKKVTRYVRAILLNVRAEPRYRSPIVRRLYGGAKLQVEIHGSYAKIREGQWVHTRYLSSKPTKKATLKDVRAAWERSKYKDTWKPGR